MGLSLERHWRHFYRVRAAWQKPPDKPLTDMPHGPALASRAKADRLPWLVTLAGLAAAVWYFILPALLMHQAALFAPFHPALLGTAFNSMARHLLDGRFDVDPDAIDFEAFLIDGRTVSYFGIFCALLRLPLAVFDALDRTDVTRISCLAAICLGAWFQVRAVLMVRAACPPSSRRTWLTVAMLTIILAGGQQIQFQRPSIYQEVLDWAGAEAMAFVFLAIRGLLASHGFDRRTVGWMAVCAGLALLTRVTFGVGLYAALGMLMLVQARLYPRAALILLGFAIATGVVNQGRWGNPLVFADFTRYAMSLDAQPERLVHLAAYGAFNPDRIWLGLSYYFLPVWGLARGDGQLLFAEAQGRMMDSIELPAGSFLVSDPLLLVLCAVGIAAAWRRRDDASDETCELAPRDHHGPPRRLRSLLVGQGAAAGCWLLISRRLACAGPLQRWTGMADPSACATTAPEQIAPERTVRAREFALRDKGLEHFHFSGRAGNVPAHGRRIRRSETGLLLGLALPPVLMLCAISMTWRYRMEFYPLLVLGALLGFRHLCGAAAPRRFGRRAKAAIILAVVVSVAVSHAMAAVYAVSPWGPAEPYLARQGWFGTYAPLLLDRHPAP
jgi:hypothetical protein